MPLSWGHTSGRAARKFAAEVQSRLAVRSENLRKATFSRAQALRRFGYGNARFAGVGCPARLPTRGRAARGLGGQLKEGDRGGRGTGMAPSPEVGHDRPHRSLVTGDAPRTEALPGRALGGAPRSGAASRDGDRLVLKHERGPGRHGALTSSEPRPHENPIRRPPLRTRSSRPPAPGPSRRGGRPPFGGERRAPPPLECRRGG